MGHRCLRSSRMLLETESVRWFAGRCCQEDGVAVEEGRACCASHTRAERRKGRSMMERLHSGEWLVLKIFSCSLSSTSRNDIDRVDEPYTIRLIEDPASRVSSSEWCL